MPLFSRKPADRQRRLSDLLKIAHKVPTYQSLARVVGKKHADSAVEMSYPMDSGLVQGDEQRLANDISQMLQKELKDVLAGHYDIGRIAGDAASGVFSRDTWAGRYLKPSDYGAAGPDSDTLK